MASSIMPHDYPTWKASEDLLAAQNRYEKYVTNNSLLKQNNKLNLYNLVALAQIKAHAFSKHPHPTPHHPTPEQG